MLSSVRVDWNSDSPSNCVCLGRIKTRVALKTAISEDEYLSDVTHPQCSTKCFVHVMFSLAGKFPLSISESLLEVKLTGDLVKCAVVLSKLGFEDRWKHTGECKYTYSNKIQCITKVWLFLDI